MDLIKRIEVSGFRSLRSIELDSIDGFSCLVGANNSGKSNVLRALNLFFNDEPEPGKELDFSYDHHFAPHRKKKKEISVAVTFVLPDNFTFQPKVRHLEKTLGRKFTIKRTWTTYPYESDTEFRRRGRNWRRLDDTVFQQFIDLINFRYIQNRTIPADVLKMEAPRFGHAVMKRFRKKRAAETDRLLQGIKDAADTTIAKASKQVTSDIASIARLVMGTPDEAVSILGLSGFAAATPSGALIPSDAVGAGSQAYVMFLLLKDIDTTYEGTFGWRQGVVWAVEEPESSLHKDLEQKLAIMLRSWTDEDALKMQILATTHSDVITTASNAGFFVETDGSATSITAKKIPELVSQAATAGVSSPFEPALCFPSNTVVLVEGPLDRMVLENVSRRTKAACGFVFVCLHELDQAEAGSGVDKIVDYLKRRGPVIQNRPAKSPLLVLFDHDVTDDKLRQARKYYGTNGDSRVIRMSANHADARVSTSLGGIERFYPRSLFMKARQGDTLPVSVDQQGNVSIVKRELSPKAKRELAHLLCDGPPQWCTHLDLVLRDLETAALASSLSG